MKINIIVATSYFGGIGIRNTLPFACKKDMKHFTKMTKGNGNYNNAVLMGRKTWESLPIKPLPDRDNYVISKTLSGDNVYNSITKCLHDCREKKYNTLWIIGGEKIYNSFIFEKYLSSTVDRIYMTKIHKQYDCDVFFPVDEVCNGEKWKRIESKTEYEKNTQLDFSVYEHV